MELYNKEKKKAEVSMRKKGWKDNEDSSLEKFMEIQKANKRVRKDMDALISVYVRFWLQIGFSIPVSKSFGTVLKVRSDIPF